jgi:hypothetical protein
MEQDERNDENSGGTGTHAIETAKDYGRLYKQSRLNVCNYDARKLRNGRERNYLTRNSMYEVQSPYPPAKNGVF